MSQRLAELVGPRPATTPMQDKLKELLAEPPEPKRVRFLDQMYSAASADHTPVSPELVQHRRQAVPPAMVGTQPEFSPVEDEDAHDAAEITATDLYEADDASPLRLNSKHATPKQSPVADIHTMLMEPDSALLAADVAMSAQDERINLYDTPEPSSGRRRLSAEDLAQQSDTATAVPASDPIHGSAGDWAWLGRWELNQDSVATPAFSASGPMGGAAAAPPVQASENSLAHWGIPDHIRRNLAKLKITTLHPWQVKCLRSCPEVLSGRGSLIYTAPTSGGKTLVALLLLIRHVVRTRKKVLFVLPLVSLVVANTKKLARMLAGSKPKIRVRGYYANHGMLRLCTR